MQLWLKITDRTPGAPRGCVKYVQLSLKIAHRTSGAHLGGAGCSGEHSERLWGSLQVHFGVRVGLWKSLGVHFGLRFGYAEPSLEVRLR